MNEDWNGAWIDGEYYQNADDLIPPGMDEYGHCSQCDEEEEDDYEI